MRPAARNAYVLIQEASFVRDTASNEKIPTWAEYRYVWVSMRALRGREQAGDTQVATVQRWTIMGDFYDLDGVTESMRIVHSPSGNYEAATDWVYFDIEAVAVDFTDRSSTQITARLGTSSDVGAN